MVQLGVNSESGFSSSSYEMVPVNYRFPCLIPPHRIQRQVAAQHAQVLAQQYAAQLLQFNNMGGGLVSRRRPTHTHNQVGAPTQNNNHPSHTHPPPVIRDANPTTTSPLDSSLSTLQSQQQQPSPLLSTSDHVNIVSSPSTPLSSSVQSPSTQVLAAAPSSSYSSGSLLSSPAPSSGSLSTGLTIIDEASLLEQIASSSSPISAPSSSSSSSSSSSLSLSPSSSSSSGCSSSVSRSLVSVIERSEEGGSGSVGAIRHTPRIREKRLAAQAQSTRRPKLQLPRDNRVLSELSLSPTASASSDVLPISVCDASASTGSVTVSTSSSSGRTSSTIDGSIAQMFTSEMQIEGSDAGVSKSSRDDNNNNNDGNLSSQNSTAQRTAAV